MNKTATTSVPVHRLLAERWRLLLVATRTVGADGAPMPWAHYDAGQAVAHLSVQAEAEGLVVHQMGGFDPAAAAAACALDEGVAPVVVVAIGVRSDSVVLPEPYAGRETAPRTRAFLSDLLLDPVSGTLRLSA